MYALVCLSFLACAFAAPQYFYPPPPPPPPQHHHHHHHDGLTEYMSGGLFDTKSFFNDFNSEMFRFEQMMQEFLKNFPKSDSTSGVQGNEYKINIILQGFEEKEITVKAREGLIMVQAVHRDEFGSERNYLDIRSLPTTLKADSGSWTYEQGILRIVFPLKQDSITTEATESPELTEVITQEPEVNQDREEMEDDDNDNTDLDADVGVRGDSDSEIMTNEIPVNKVAQPVETTTYAVDFSNDVEFVPVQMQQLAK